jgi:hypothetical protein
MSDFRSEVAQQMALATRLDLVLRQQAFELFKTMMAAAFAAEMANPTGRPFDWKQMATNAIDIGEVFNAAVKEKRHSAAPPNGKLT